MIYLNYILYFFISLIFILLKTIYKEYSTRVYIKIIYILK